MLCVTKAHCSTTRKTTTMTSLRTTTEGSPPHTTREKLAYSSEDPVQPKLNKQNIFKEIFVKRNELHIRKYKSTGVFLFFFLFFCFFVQKAIKNKNTKCKFGLKYHLDIFL